MITVDIVTAVQACVSHNWGCLTAILHHCQTIDCSMTVYISFLGNKHTHMQGTCFDPFNCSGDYSVISSNMLWAFVDPLNG